MRTESVPIRPKFIQYDTVVKIKERGMYVSCEHVTPGQTSDGLPYHSLQGCSLKNLTATNQTILLLLEVDSCTVNSQLAK